MRFSVPVLALLVFALPLAADRKPATQPGNYEAWGPDIDKVEIVKTFDASRYKRVYVERLDFSKTAAIADPDVADKAAKVLGIATEPFVEGISKSIRGLEVVTTQPADDAGTLILRGGITLMDPGSRSKRLFIGYGAGAARTAIEAEILDADTGEVLVRFTQERRSGIERFGRGSSYEEIMKRNLTAIGRDAANLLNVF
jgi:hypothetical protein